MSLGDFDNYMNKVRDVPGDFAEFGVYHGEITLQLASTGRHTWAWDTFEGMPDDNYIEDLDKSDPPGKWKPDFDVVRKLASSGYYITTVPGKFSQTIPDFCNGPHRDTKFAFVHIDCDHYWAYKRVLEFIAPRMSPGGVVRMDDYGCCAGARKAADEWSAATGHKLEGDLIFF